MKNYDLSFIDLKNPQEEPKRDNVFYVEFPPTWQTQDLFDLFSPFGSVYIGWINDSSAFVGLQNADNIKKAAAQLVGVVGREYRVYFYTTYVNQISKNKNRSVNSQVGNAISAINTAASEAAKKVKPSPVTADDTSSKEKRKRNEKNGGNNAKEKSESEESCSSTSSDKKSKKIKNK